MAWELVDNIRGPKGDKGDRGTISSISVATLPPEASATASMSGTTDVHVHFGIPRGAKGEQGVPGTLSSASAESVPADAPAEVIMSGTTEVKHAHFKVPRGLPGTNAIENDAAVAAYVLAVDSATKAALNGDYPVKRVWDGTAYPARVPGATNLFIGPVDPGLAMTSDDVWADPAVTTIAEVVAAILDPSSAMRAAIQTAVVAPSVSIPLTLRNGESAQYTVVNGIPGFYGWNCPQGAQNRLAGTVKIPQGWNTAAVRIFYIPAVSGSGNLRLARAGVAYKSGAPVRTFGVSTNTLVVGPIDSVSSHVVSGSLDVTDMDEISIEVQRTGNSTSDTFAAAIFILSARLERLS
ncbi:hypothetical protein K8F61_05110 [Microbacterium resistens]|uniref:Minor tail protein n=1 Tax=Microbacterium resistens TaxID=156977 RepID=A0ABY3RUE1_9MICO|nr:hypothetical protein [Microbacterium resistens]UGS27569.1 hypothetical protein K8F61_05110 [Microbacterium resistens]